MLRREHDVQFNEAHKLVNDALRRGKLKRPKLCEICGNTPEPTKYQREQHMPAIQAHHTNYANPLEIMWLCLPCHRKEHNR